MGNTFGKIYFIKPVCTSRNCFSNDEYNSAGVSVCSAIPAVLRLLSTFPAHTIPLLSTPWGTFGDHSFQLVLDHTLTGGTLPQECTEMKDKNITLTKSSEIPSS